MILLTVLLLTIPVNVTFVEVVSTDAPGMTEHQIIDDTVYYI